MNKTSLSTPARSETAEREVVRLGTAAGENHAIGPRVSQVGAQYPPDAFPGVFEHLPGTSPRRVLAGRVGPGVLLAGAHGVGHLGEDRGGSVVIEVDRGLHTPDYRARDARCGAPGPPA